MAGKVRILKEKLFKVKKDDTKLLYVEGACDNDATPPQGNFVTGSAFENVTSGNKYKYSETSGDWILQPSEGGTGGGVLVCTEDENGVLDKTWNEINNANLAVIIENSAAGKVYVFVTIAMNMGGTYKIQGISSMMREAIYLSYSASTADDYPVLE